MRNPSRTTKRERRFIRRYNPYAARILGVAEAARWYREGVLLDEARGFDNILNDLKYGLVPLDLNDRVNAAIDGQRDRLERILGTTPGALKSTSSNVNHYSVHERKLALTAAVNARLNGYGVNNAEGEVEPLGPSACGHYQVVEMPASVPYRNGARQADATFAALYQAYREGRERGNALEWKDEPVPDPMMRLVPVDEPFAPIDPSLLLGEYQAYRAGHDPNEVAAVHAEAIENALNDDIDPGE